MCPPPERQGGIQPWGGDNRLPPTEGADAEPPATGATPSYFGKALDAQRPDRDPREILGLIVHPYNNPLIR